MLCISKVRVSAKNNGTVYKLSRILKYLQAILYWYIYIHDNNIRMFLSDCAYSFFTIRRLQYFDAIHSMPVYRTYKPPSYYILILNYQQLVSQSLLFLSIAIRSKTSVPSSLVLFRSKQLSGPN